MSDLTKLMLSFILGALQGIAEFLPISSTGHIILIENFLNCIDDSMQVFTIIIQLGSILSLLVVFRYRLCNMFVRCVPNIFSKTHYSNEHLCIQHIFVGTLPGIILGMVFYEQIKLLLFEPTYILYGLILGGIFLLIGEYCSFKLYLIPISKNMDKITCFQAFLIGCFQCLAFWPGFSRSGATIGGGLLVGLDRRVASEFSFFLAIPIILGSAILTLWHYTININDIINVLILIIGFMTAFIVAFLTVKLLLKIINNISLIPFAIYRFLLAFIIYSEG